MPAYRSKRSSYGGPRGMARRSMYSMSRKGTGRFVRGAKPGFQQLRAGVRGRGVIGETKALDMQNMAAGTTGGFNAQFTLGNVNSISQNLVIEGAGFYNRIGRKIAMQSWTVRATITLLAIPSAQLVPETLRIIIGYDRQPNGVAATFNQVIQSYSQQGAFTNTVYDGPNMDNRDRFIILRDKYISMPGEQASGVPIQGPPFSSGPASIGTSGSDGGALWRETIQLGNLETQYNGTTSPLVVASINTGNLFMLLQGEVGGQWSLIGGARLRFTDN
nr:MAG: capsid protein [Cressdnaviricota sp.]